MGKLKDWFGPSRAEIWKKLSDELGTRYTAGTWRKSDRLDVEHGPWTITLDTFMVHANNAHLPFTRLRAPFVDAEHLRLKIYRSSIFTEIGKWFGMQDIEVGSVQFDKDFVIKTNHEAKVRAFCGNASLRQKLSAQKSITLSVEDNEGWFGPKFPPDTDELRLVVLGHLKDPDRIKELFDLFAEALDQLCAIGAAYEQKPGLSL